MKTLFTSLILCLAAIALFLAIKYTGIFYAAIAFTLIHSVVMRDVRQYLYAIAYIIDVLVQVFCGKFLQFIFCKTYYKNSAWGRAISISACLGSEELRGNLNKLGKALVRLLNKIEEDHCLMAWETEKRKL